MLQTLKHTPKWLLAAALQPRSALAGLRYRISGLKQPHAGRRDNILKNIAPLDDDFRHMSFTFTVIALSARVACCNGPLTHAAYIAFRESFPLKSGICGKIRSLFALACRNQTPIEHYTAQIRHIYPSRPELFASLVDRLFRIAIAGGPLSRAQERLLSGIAHGLEIGASDYDAIRKRYAAPMSVSERKRAGRVLGISGRVSTSMLKKRYHELMRRYHPDRFAADDLSPELEMLLKLKASEISAAYRTLLKKAA